MPTIAVVDALYAKTATLLVGKREQRTEVPRDWLPPNVREGDVVRIAERPATIRRVALAMRDVGKKAKPPSGWSVQRDPQETEKFNSWAYQMLNHGEDLRAQLLKVPHHGSDNGISYEVIAYIRPRLTVVSVGSNSHGLPAPATIGHLEELVGAENVYRTDSHGNIVMELGWERCVSRTGLVRPGSGTGETVSTPL